MQMYNIIRNIQFETFWDEFRLFQISKQSSHVSENVYISIFKQDAEKEIGRNCQLCRTC
jgi:hypothetical protein